MDFVEINKFTREKDVAAARNNCYNCTKINKSDSLRLILYACKRMYGMRNTIKIIHGLGVDKIDLTY